MIKKLFAAVLIFSAFSYSANAQSFFKALPKKSPKVYLTPNGGIRRLDGAPLPSTMNQWRPLVNIAAYTVPGNILMAGTGPSYQHLQWNNDTQKWDCIWSVGAMVWAGGSLNPQTNPSSLISYGPLVGFFNNLLVVGAAYNGNRVLGMVGIGINLNN